MTEEPIVPALDPEEESEELFEYKSFTADKGQTLLRVDKYLVQCMGGASRNRIQAAAKAGCILVNGKPVKSNYRIKPLDKVQVMLDHEPADYTIIPEDIPLEVTYEDDDVMVINKPAGLVVHPGIGNVHGTLLNAIAWHLKDNPKFDANNPHIGLVHRIDKDTSGLLVVAKTEDAKAHLGKQFYDKTTSRTYHALVWGVMKEDEGTIDGDLGRDPHDRLRFCVFPNGENPQAKHAVTHYRVIERFTYTTLVECRLETGRTHQIRVHMRHIGHPLFSDERYGGAEVLKGNMFGDYRNFIRHCFETCPRQALHAQTLGFVHPTTGKEMSFSASYPDDFDNIIKLWRQYTLDTTKQ
ncbi:MAG: RluA family pseudouridine synthase [Paludibacteraceae bacterium]|nr:RluA family pseudouridine synthase [Paludibacteraceae bacterium]